MSKKPDPAVHLALLTPWRDARDDYYGDDDASSRSNAVFTVPGQYSAGDRLIVVTPARVRTVVAIRELEAGDESPHLELSDASDDGFPLGVSVPAVERQLGCTLPEAPSTLDPEFGRRVIDAIGDEGSGRTPWYATDTSRCVSGPPENFDEGYYLVQDSRYICSCCERDLNDHPLAAAGRAFSWHWPIVRDGDEDCQLNTQPVRVCETCHAMLHSPFGPSPMELLYSYRPECPECRKHAAARILWGMPPRPPGPGTIVAGCSLDLDNGPLPDHRCTECGHEWAAGEENL